MPDSDTIDLIYRFKLSSGNIKEFFIKLDSKTLNLITPQKDMIYPDWTKLKNFKCPVCTLDERSNIYCPIAVCLVEVVDFFSKSISCEEVDVEVITKQRTYFKHTSLQKGLSSLIGIYMPSSGCPVMGKLKPMVRYHLPFATLEETSYRLISMYLVAQYFLYKNGKIADWELKKLARIYDDVQVVNRNICEKLRKLKIEDAILNGLVALDCFASSANVSSYEDVLDDLEFVFKVFF